MNNEWKNAKNVLLQNSGWACFDTIEYSRCMWRSSINCKKLCSLHLARWHFTSTYVPRQPRSLL